MKKRQIRICIFISMALLLLFNTVSLADEETSLDDKLAEIVGKVEIVGYDKKISADDSEDGKTHYIDPIYFVKYPSEYFNENNRVVIDGKEYECFVALDRGKGIIDDTYTITRPTSYNAYANGYISQFAFRDVNDVDSYNKAFKEGKMVYYLRDLETGEIVAQYKVSGDSAKLIDPSKNEHVDPTEETGLWGAGVDALVHGDFSGLGKILTESIVKLLLPCGDGFLHMMAKALGEVVTIDKIVFGEVEKISIDFFSSGDTNTSGKVVPLKNTLSDVISPWYAFFLKIAILFYSVLLVYMGLRIILASTGDKKAEYKTRLVAWTMGVVMLMFFPYVMKYTILANKGLCVWIGEVVNDSTKMDSFGKNGHNIADDDIWDLKFVYGRYEFVAYALGYDSFATLSDNSITGRNVFGNNIMMKIRYLAQANYSLPLAVVYLILLGETFTLVIMYYKRVFMLAFLITIFPLAAMFYTLNKTR